MKIKNLETLIYMLVCMLLLGSVAFGQETITKTFYSPNYWSGEGKAFSPWYGITTPPAPNGYVLDSVHYALEGDRQGCYTYAECRGPQIHPDGSVHFEFRLQGHDEKFPTSHFEGVDSKGVKFSLHGRKATSRAVLTITYRKPH